MADNSQQYWSNYEPESGDIYIYQINGTGDYIDRLNDDYLIGYGKVKGATPTERFSELKKFLEDSHRKGWPQSLDHIVEFFYYEKSIQEFLKESNEAEVFEETKDEVKTQVEENVVRKPELNAERTETEKPQTEVSEKEEGSVIEEILLGDLYEGKPSIGGLIGNVAVGLTPILGQIADIRDTLVAIKGVYDNPRSYGAWGNLGLTGLAWIPLLGDGLKATKKFSALVKGTSKVAEAAGERTTRHLVEHSAKEIEEILAKKQDEISQGTRAVAGKQDDSLGELLTQSEIETIAADPRFIDRTSRAGTHDIATYEELKRYDKLARRNDGLDSDEVTQNLFWREKYGVGRNDELIKNNIAIALPEKVHKKIKNLNSRSIKGMDAEQVLNHHLVQMLKTREIPIEAILEVQKEARKHLAMKGMLK